MTPRDGLPAWTVRGRGRWLLNRLAPILLLVVTLAVATSVGLMVRSGNRGSDAKPAVNPGERGSDANLAVSDQPSGVSCFQIGTYDPEYCRRVVEDSSRRRSAADQSRVSDATLMTIQTTVSDASCPPVDGPDCVGPSADLGPTEADVDAVKQALKEAGFPNVMVRMTRGDDPAPTRALIYGVQVEHLCVVGSQRQLSLPSKPPEVVGLLPEGRCLQ